MVENTDMRINAEMYAQTLLKQDVRHAEMYAQTSLKDQA